MMSLRAALIAICAALLFAAPVLAPHAADGGETDGTTPDTGGATDPYGSGSSEVKSSTYLTGEDSPFALPSGLMNLKSDSKGGFDGNLTTDVSGSDNLQGCGGVTQSDYTSAVFNMPEVFDKFKKDVNTNLAKQILTYNYSLPQTAALFDTLNTYGNARFQQFQQGCNLDALKQDAKQQFVKSCMTQSRIDERKKIIQDANNGSSGSGSGSGTGGGSSSQQSKFTDDEVNAQAYAQVWELCNNMYVSDTTLVQLHKDVNKAFAESLRKAEDVNAAIKPLLCDVSETTATGGSGDTNSKACWANLLLPQVRLCNGDFLDKGCDKSGYGIKDAPLTLTAYFDYLRLSLSDFVKTIVDDFYHQTNIVDIPTQEQSAEWTSFDLMKNGMTEKLSADASVKQFQSYLNCKSNDIGYSLSRYGLMINNMQEGKVGDGPEQGASGTTPTAGPKVETKTYGYSNYKTIADKMVFPATADADKSTLPYLAETALGCTVNQIIPMTDPKITSYISTECGNINDRSAFYTMSSYDVALNATRDTYRYLSIRLKQVYGRLLNESGAGVSGTLPSSSSGTGDAAATATALDSPELRRRLASAVKEVMLPAVETQIERLNELNATRGQFSQRVQKIYKDRQGCVSSPSAGQGTSQ